MTKKNLLVDGKSILARYENRQDREKVSLYLSKDLYTRFKKACKKAPASRVMEELMQVFMDSVAGKNS